MTDPRSFGAWLRRERERRDITIRTIADRTKIGASLLEALERGDVSRWPGGIYRRAFLRAYADVVGLDADVALANFERLFPSDDSQPAPSRAVAASVQAQGDEDSEMRLQLAVTRGSSTWAAARTACLDLAFVLVAGLAGFAAAGWIGFWCVAAVTAVVYHVTGVLGMRTQPVRRPQEQAERQPAPRPLAPVVAFSGEQSRSTSRRARARRMAATLSAVAIPAASFRRRRAARS
jgi:transcriptional regulator with XRE-family HTH domain